MELTACRNCGSSISEAKLRRHAIYCSKDCADQVSRNKWRSLNPHRLNVPSCRRSHVGAANELFVAYDLMMKGYEVFRALSPDCPSDLAILKNGALLCVQVRTGYKSIAGNVSYGKKKTDKYDLLAIVVGEEIIYQPESF